MVSVTYSLNLFAHLFTLNIRCYLIFVDCIGSMPSDFFHYFPIYTCLKHSSSTLQTSNGTSKPMLLLIYTGKKLLTIKTVIQNCYKRSS